MNEPVDLLHAPHPVNDSERLVFRQVYETLVHVDCQRRVRPALASAWQLEPDGRTWIVTLREDARFSDGTPVTPADVAASWTPADPRRPQVNPYVESVGVTGDRTLAITLRDPSAPAPLVLADANLAIARRSNGSAWPLGTRGTMLAFEQLPDAGGRAAISVVERPMDASAGDAGARPWSIRFVVAPGRDPRDLLDQAIDLVLTRNPAALDYAGTLPQFQSLPLAWNRTHVFLSPSRDRSASQPTPESRQTLAADAVRGEGRGAQEPFWWQSQPGCDAAKIRAREVLVRRPSDRIVYEREDGAGRDLAERIVALARAAGARPAALIESLLPGATGSAFQRATALTRDAFAAALAGANEAGYIVSIDSRPLAPCAELRRLAERAPWLDRDALVPLVDTRQRAIVRRGRSGISADWDGALVFARRPRAR